VRDVTGSDIPQITAVEIIAQALAGWFDFVLDDQGRVHAERFEECTAVVDIGGRTTDVAVVQRGEIDLRLSGTEDLGTRELSAAVNRMIEEQIPGIPRRPHNFVEGAIQRGVARVGGREIDMRDALEREKTDLLDRITDYLAGLHGRFMSDIDHMLWIGGGSALLEPHLRKRFSRSDFLDDPVLSNARGMLKFERYSHPQEFQPEQGTLELVSDTVNNIQ
jgi:plasmid segregation protein ParM